MDIKRTVLWVIFSFTLIMLWNGWGVYSGKPSIFAPPPPKVASASASANASASASSAAGSASAVTGATATAGTDAAPVIKSETITITTDVVKADIDTIGGELKKLELLKHKDGTDHTKNMVLFDNSTKRTYLAQTGLLGGPFPNHKSGFIAKPGVRTLEGGNQVQLVLEAEQGGVKLTKTYTFKKGEYLIDVRHDVTNTGTAAIKPSLYLQLLHDGTKPESGGMFSGSGEFYAPAVYTEAEKFQKLDFEKIAKGTDGHAKESDNGWVAMLQHFFVSSFIPQDKVKREIFTKKVDTNLYAVGNVLPMGTVAPGATVSMNAHLYSGPQESAKLEAIAPGFELVKDYGVLTLIAKPLFWVMEQIHKMLGNWGWTIVVFTIAIKLALFPLSAAGYRSMAKMKVVTPKMQAVRERFKNDPQKMNQAMMELYKTEKINPLGGCFPILIQMPIFLALYWVLQASVEMRGAPWVGWITDLTSPDPWYILPVVYAISMFITTKLNPAPADPVQAKMMMFMPLAFSVMFFFFPSGLVLYWVVNNILSIAQQWVINNKLIPPEHKA
ncbi:membrane protein insertase YidC [Undibacterium sp. Tian12W]|uniref:membrane protein insertase YidC n=1 Tax=Undibacterium sp. Tian12W TaxID=3413054 RepID=UPI003BF27CCF